MGLVASISPATLDLKEAVFAVAYLSAVFAMVKLARGGRHSGHIADYNDIQHGCCNLEKASLSWGVRKPRPEAESLIASVLEGRFRLASAISRVRQASPTPTSPQHWKGAP
ncbi:hypothetical protein ACRE_010490 [Hapsidospora chrysogenum ATCC 11550]|uniref:Uncharacterized protein n=1 Tax=Hapsidospora chrysogenum (strain ATCC 11550 / CBS 779.69 / DSM 880 / IAM 14645 / JCM 23072 / IMI 49137) TaxID=857340 RepID=A0A086TF88_HAPC1|nr:hypothetical protein ACRE_010490 [Hapsidospora chrysogenum ATCC 11550]